MTMSDAEAARETARDPPAGGTADESSARTPFLKGFAALFALGLTGVAAVGLAVAGVIPGVPGLGVAPSPNLVLAAVLNSALLVAVAAGVGTALAPRLGLRSHVRDRAVRGDPILPRLRSELPISVAVGVASFLATVVLDVAFAPLVAADLGDAVAGATAAAPTIAGLIGGLPVRLLYGGVTEELLLRWGFMSLVAWPLWFAARKVIGSSTVGPSAAVMWAAIAVSALAFGVGHLPAAATVAPLTPAFAARTVLLNAVVGVAFGWLFWRKSLEAAMIAHGTFHVALVALSAGLLLLG